MYESENSSLFVSVHVIISTRPDIEYIYLVIGICLALTNSLWCAERFKGSVNDIVNQLII